MDLGALFEDVAYSEEADLPMQYDLRFSVEGHEIYGSIYTPSPCFGSKRPVVLFFHGFTGFVRMEDVLMALLRAGCVVAQVHHRGSWGSQGTYLPTNCIEDAAALAEWAQTEDFCQRYGTDPNAVFLMGHSLGGNTVLNALGRTAGVRGAILLTPGDISALLAPMTNEQRLKLFAGNGVEVLSYEGDQALVDNVMENAHWMNFPAAAQRLPEVPLMVVTGTKDPICPVETMVAPLLEALEQREYSAPVVHKEYFSRHSLMGVRVQLARDVATFIQGIL